MDINASWHMSPKAADRAGAALRQYPKWALPNDALWYILYRGKIIDEKKTPEPARREAALNTSTSFRSARTMPPTAGGRTRRQVR